jgi:hypothetical protein
MLPLSSLTKCLFPKSDKEQKRRQREDTITQFCRVYFAQLSSLRTMTPNLKSKWINLGQALLIATNRFRKKLLRNTIKVYAGDYPALLYSSDGFDPDDPESGLLRNPILVRVSAIGFNFKIEVQANSSIQYQFFKHIFTAPTSAKDSLSAPNKTKTKHPQAELNNMKKVTPGSIVYAALMVCAHHIPYTLLTLFSPSFVTV